MESLEGNTSVMARSCELRNAEALRPCCEASEILAAATQVKRALVMLLWKCPSDRKRELFVKVPKNYPMLRSAENWKLPFIWRSTSSQRCPLGTRQGRAQG